MCMCSDDLYLHFYLKYYKGKRRSYRRDFLLHGSGLTTSLDKCRKNSIMQICTTGREANSVIISIIFRYHVF